MYHLVIADDEMIIRRGLESVPWPDYSFQVVGVAKNALEVLEIFETQQVDVLLTDIRMPGMNGLELSERVLALNPAIKIVYLTGYSEFEYARQALKQGAADYLLKPIGDDELIACMNRVREMLEEEKKKVLEDNRQKKELDNFRLLAQSGEFMKNEPADAEQENMISTILAYIMDHYTEKISLVSLSEALHFSTGYVSKLIKKKTGFTFLEILTNIRMYYAARLLSTTDLKGFEICDRIGFSDEHYFTQVFKKIYGMTPNEYKRRAGKSAANPLAKFLEEIENH